MLKALVRHPRQPLSRDKLAQLARGREFEPFDRSLDVQISRLRKMIEPGTPPSPRYIQTVWGVGCVFVPDGSSSGHPPCCHGRGDGSARQGPFAPTLPPPFRHRSPPGPLARTKLAFSLFWRTFFLLALLLLGGVFAWMQTFRALELEPPRAGGAADRRAGQPRAHRAAGPTPSTGVADQDHGQRQEVGAHRSRASRATSGGPSPRSTLSRAIGAELRAQPRHRHRRGQLGQRTSSRACGSASRSTRIPTGCRPIAPRGHAQPGAPGAVGRHRAVASVFGGADRTRHQPARCRSCPSPPAASAAASSSQRCSTRTP